MIDNITSIKEEVFKIENRPWTQKFFNKDTLFGFEYAHCIYTGEDRKVELIDGFLTSSPLFIGYTDKFVNFLLEHSPKKIKDFLFLLDVYHQACIGQKETDLSKLLNIERTGLPIDAVLDELLNDSNGIILWHHQLENILSLCFHNRQEVIDLRKKINAKVGEGWSLLDKAYIGDGLTLRQIITQRMVFGTTKYPNVKGAYILHEVLNPQK